MPTHCFNPFIFRFLRDVSHLSVHAIGSNNFARSLKPHYEIMVGILHIYFILLSTACRPTVCSFNHAINK